MGDDPKNDNSASEAPAQAGQPDDQDDGGDKAETLITKRWVAARFSEMFVVGAAGPRASKQQENVVSATNKRYRVRCHGRSTMHLPCTPDTLLLSRALQDRSRHYLHVCQRSWAF